MKWGENFNSFNNGASIIDRLNADDIDDKTDWQLAESKFKFLNAY